MDKVVYQVKGKELEESPYESGMQINDGDVYAFDDPASKVIWVWIGKNSSVEESTVAAWFANELDKKRDGVPEVMTIEQGSEPMLFRENFTIEPIEADTPGFLKKAELDLVEYKLFRIFIEKDTSAFDDAKMEEVSISKDSLSSDDVFVLDGNDSVFCFIGANCQMEEKLQGQKVMQKIDAGRQYEPLQYTIYEGEGSKSEDAFYTLLDKIEEMDPSDRKTLSVEDRREQTYVPEESRSAEDHLKETDSQYETTDPSERPERVIEAGTDAHHNVLRQQGGTIKGLKAVSEGLPQKGSVAARIAAINKKVEEPDEEETKKEEPKKDAVKATTKYDRTAIPQSGDPENTGPVYRGDDSDVVTRSRLEDATRPKYDYEKEKNCQATENHTIIWDAGKVCAVCKLGPPPKR